MKLKKRILGTVDRPRFAVYKSNNHIYVQAIDDIEACTLLAFSTLKLELKELQKTKKPCDIAFDLGFEFGKKLIEKNITKGVFDRRNKPYHGRIAALANGIRKAGVIF